MILISEKPKIQIERKPIAEEFVKYGSRFFLPGYLKLYKTWRKPNLYVKIIHNCFKSRIAAKKVFLKPIPQNFVYRGYRMVQFFDLGNLDLADLTSRLLLDKRRNTLKW
uniref:Ribosomal protein S16 n=1 Tax=Strongyloides papillosus TaxID=174720 RepID=A0A0N5C7J3_STREA